MNKQKKSIEELRKDSNLASKLLNNPTVEEVPVDCVNECLEILYNEKCLSKNDFTFLKKPKNKELVSKAIRTITSHGLDKIILGFFENETTISNVTNNIKNKIVNVVESSSYYKLKENHLTNSINHSLPSSRKTVETVDMFTKKGTVKVGNIKYEIEYFNDIKKFIKTSTSKLFAFAIMNLKNNTNTSNFTLSEYTVFLGKLDKKEVALKLRGNKDTIQEKIKLLQNKKNDVEIENLKKKVIIGDLDILKMIGNVRYSNAKKDILSLDTLIYSAEYNRGKISFEFKPEFVKSLENYYMFIPKKMATINDRKYPHAWVLGYYIFEQARTNKTCIFELTIEKCLIRTTIPTYTDVKEKYKRKYNEKIIEPFDKTIDIISETVKNLTIEYKNNYNSIDEFIKGKIKINITSNNIKCNYNELLQKRKNKNLEKNKELKLNRKKKAIQLKNEGKTTLEISKILELTTKTINNYLK